MTYKDIPPDVLASITAAAKEWWEDDPEELASVIEKEVDCYRRFRSYDFGEAAQHKAQIVKYSDDVDVWGGWEECLDTLVAEVEAYSALRSMEVQDVPEAFVKQCRSDAMAQCPESFVDQLDHVENEIGRFQYIADVRQRVEPVRQLVIEIERAIGNRCYNSKIQNYGAGGVWEGEGRSFRYPLSIIDGEHENKKHWTVPGDIPAEELITGLYKFGANELGVVRAIFDIIELIEDRYGVDLRDVKRKK